MAELALSPDISRPIFLTLLTEDRSKVTSGILTLSSSEKKNCRRAVLKVIGERAGVKNRFWGCRTVSALDSVTGILSKMPDRISDEEFRRVSRVLKTDYAPSKGNGSQPRVSHVRIIHQIYGLFRDNKPMSRLFQNSLQRWRQVAENMGAIHHLWSADEVDALVKQFYPQVWPAYRNVPFSVMRADIARVVILHKHGGMYVDCDIFPNRETYTQSDLAIQKIYSTSYSTSMFHKHLEAQRKHSVAGRKRLAAQRKHLSLIHI